MNATFSFYECKFSGGDTLLHAKTFCTHRWQGCKNFGCECSCPGHLVKRSLTVLTSSMMIEGFIGVEIKIQQFYLDIHHENISGE